MLIVRLFPFACAGQSSCAAVCSKSATSGPRKVRLSEKCPISPALPWLYVFLEDVISRKVSSPPLRPQFFKLLDLRQAHRAHTMQRGSPYTPPRVRIAPGARRSSCGSALAEPRDVQRLIADGCVYHGWTGSSVTAAEVSTGLSSGAI